MTKKSRRRFSAEFKEEAVKLALIGEVSIAELGANLGVSTSSLRNWLAQAIIDRGAGRPGAITTEERAELRSLRRELRQVRMERDILKKATVFFAKESR
jgi:transposase